MSVHEEDDGESLRRELIDQFGDAVMEDDPPSTEDGFGETDSLMPDEDEGPIDFSTTAAQAISSSSEDEDEEEEEETRETNPLRRLIKVRGGFHEHEQVPYRYLVFTSSMRCVS
jgi:hypothetical protein